MSERRTRRLKSTDDVTGDDKQIAPNQPQVAQTARTRRRSEKIADRHSTTIPQGNAGLNKKPKKDKKVGGKSAEGMPSLLLSDVIKAGEQLTSPNNPEEYQNRDIYRIMDILLRGTGMSDPLVAVAIQFVEQLVKTKNIMPLGLVEKRKFLTSTMGLTQKSIVNIDKIISAIKIQKTARGFLARQRLRKLRALYSSVDWPERNNTFLRWLADEEDYGRKLKVIIDEFKIPLELKKDLIQPSDADKIFSNIHILLETQKSIITLLRSVLPTHPHIVGLGDKWCEVAPFLKNYGPYVENSAHALTTLYRLINTNSKFKMFISSINPTDSCPTLDHLLQLPISRIAKYQEFLKIMLKNTPIKHPDYDALSKAHEVMKNANDFVLKNLAAAKNRDNILEVQRRLQNCEIPLYAEERRTYVGEAAITVIIKGKRQHRQFILFSDIALFAKQTKKDLLEFKNVINFNPSSEATDRLSGDNTLKNKKKQENPVLITNCDSDIQGPVILLFKSEEHDTWLKNIQSQVGALKRASCVVFGAPLMEMIRKCVIAGSEVIAPNIIEAGKDFDTSLLVPPFLEILISQLEKNLTEKGIYRVSGLEADIKELRSLLDKVKPATPSISQFSPHVIADVLKLYFRELPEPLLTYEFYDKVITELHKKKDSENDEYPIALREMLRLLPLPNYCIAKTLSRHLSRVERLSNHNLMGSTNLAIVFGPTLLSPQQESIEHTLMMPRVYAVVQCLIERYNFVFEEDHFTSDPVTGIERREHEEFISTPLEDSSNRTYKASTLPVKRTNSSEDADTCVQETESSSTSNTMLPNNSVSATTAYLLNSRNGDNKAPQRPYKRSVASLSNFRKADGTLRATVSDEDVRSSNHVATKSNTFKREKLAESPQDEDSQEDSQRSESTEEGLDKKKDQTVRRSQVRAHKLKKSLSMVVPREAQQQLQGMGQGRQSPPHFARCAVSANMEVEDEARKRTISS